MGMNPDSDTSASLLLRVRDPADSSAWAAFESLYGPLVRRSCRRRGLQEADAADVSQEVLVRVAKSIRGFDYAPERGKFRSWLGTITANEVRTFQTRSSRVPSAANDSDPAEPCEADPAWNAEFTEHVLAAACERIRGEFEAATWAAFEAVWMRSEPSVEVARRLGIAVHAVYVNKSRVLKRLEAEVMHLAEDIPIAGSSR
jgi:RNA polymerase sigma factor (sigma-70 family)